MPVGVREQRKQKNEEAQREELLVVVCAQDAAHSGGNPDIHCGKNIRSNSQLLFQWLVKQYLLRETAWFH